MESLKGVWDLPDVNPTDVRVFVIVSQDLQLYTLYTQQVKLGFHLLPRGEMDQMVEKAWPIQTYECQLEASGRGPSLEELQALTAF